LSAICPVQLKPVFICQERASGHRRLTFAHWSRLHRRTAVRPRPWWEQGAHRWALQSFLTVCAEILWLCKPTVSSDVRVAGLRRSIFFSVTIYYFFNVNCLWTRSCHWAWASDCRAIYGNPYGNPK
jgi:hypothetical protein